MVAANGFTSWLGYISIFPCANVVYEYGALDGTVIWI